MSISQAFGVSLLVVLTTGTVEAGGEPIPPPSFPEPSLIVSSPSFPLPPAQIEPIEPNRPCIGCDWVEAPTELHLQRSKSISVPAGPES